MSKATIRSGLCRSRCPSWERRSPLQSTATRERLHVSRRRQLAKKQIEETASSAALANKSSWTFARKGPQQAGVMPGRLNSPRKRGREREREEEEGASPSSASHGRLEPLELQLGRPPIQRQEERYPSRGLCRLFGDSYGPGSIVLVVFFVDQK